MAQFSRTTLFEACNLLGRRLQYHGAFEDLMYRWELDSFADNPAGPIHERCRQLFRHLRDNPNAEYDGRSLIDLVAEEAAKRCRFDDHEFLRALQRDGFILEAEHTLRRTHPEVIDLPAADDEVHILLDRHGLAISKGHLDQAIRAHSEGNWAAANSQYRTFLESLLDEVAIRLDPVNAPGTRTGEARRQLLANLPTPFLSRALNEWSDDGKNFVNGVFKRLHPQGSHPGLSDEEDSTFRLYLVVLTARLFLRRLDATIPGQP
jgi:hypothetical protein